MEVLARTIFGESRGQPFAGQCAVGHVILNRTKRPARFGKTVAAVCIKPLQFSCWNRNDPNFPKLMQAEITDPDYAKAFAAAALVLSGERPDPTGGADHYFADYIAKPDWAEAMLETVKIGAHRFFKESA